MKKSITILAAFCVVMFISSNVEAYTQLKNVAIHIIGNFSHGRNLTASFALIVIFSVIVYQLLLYREKKSRHLLRVEVDQLVKRYGELTEKYKNALTATTEGAVDSMDQRFLKKIIKTVEDNIGDSGFKVERMAQEIGMSRANLYRKVKDATGFSPRDLIRNIRLRKAADLLLHDAESVSQIGYIVGFEDNSYFSKSFKKEFGVPPSEYLRSKSRG